MAYPKALRQIDERLARIEKHLGIAEAGGERVLVAETGDDLDTLGLDAGQTAALREAGYTSARAVRGASADALQKVRGIGPATVKALRGDR